LLANFSIESATVPLVRSVIVVGVERISDSCEFVVPEMELVKERDQIERLGETEAAKEVQDWKREYIQTRNETSNYESPGSRPV